MSSKTLSPKVKDVMLIIGATGFVVASLVFPALPMALKPLLDYKRRKEFEDQKKYWNKYNPYVLRQTIKRLQQQKVVEITYENGEQIIKLTEKGRTKLLKYRIEDMAIKNQKWDGKWRLIIYDVPTYKELQRNMFRRFLRKMQLLKLQKSVYLTPYECQKEIEYLRQLFGVGEEVIYLTVQNIENDTAYRKYFGL